MGLDAGWIGGDRSIKRARATDASLSLSLPVCGKPPTTPTDALDGESPLNESASEGHQCESKNNDNNKINNNNNRNGLER